MLPQTAIVPNHLETAFGRGKPQVALFETDTAGARGGRPYHVRQAYLIAVPTTDTVSAIDNVLWVSHLGLSADVLFKPRRRETRWILLIRAFESGH